jgi:hypothetical protein
MKPGHHQIQQKLLGMCVRSRQSSEYHNLNLGEEGTGLNKRGSWSIGQYIKHDRTVHEI